LCRTALIVVVDKLDRPAEQPAFGVDVIFPNLHRHQRHFSVGSERAAERHAKADLDRIGSFGRRRRHKYQRRSRSRSQPRQAR